jgi:hypothetical protein
MLNTRYIEIDSTFRNRSEWPEPGQFELIISQTGNKDAKTALDPIANSAPILRWVPSDIDSISGPVLSGYNTSYDEFALQVLSSYNASKIIDYYNGCHITVGGSNVRIVSWKYLSSTSSTPFYDYFNLTITPKLSTIPAGIVDFGNVSDYSAINGVYIPNGLKEDNYYIGYYIFNETLLQTRKILKYDGTTKIAIVDAPISSWGDSDTLVLRETNPSEIIVFPYFNNSLIQLPFTNTAFNGDYIGNFIRLQTGGSTVYKITNHINVSPVSYEIISPPILRLKFTSNVLSKTTNAYTGFEIIINTIPIQKISTWTFVRTENNYDFFDLTIGTIIPNPINALIFPKMLTINGSIGTYSSSSDTYEILPFTRDNFSPFNFTGGTTSHQEAVCYEIELVNLTLPNLPLKTGTRIPFLPYVYVEFQSYTSGNYNIIYSNNPKATRMLFKVAIDDISNPEIVPFIKLKSEMTQTIKFRPTDNFRFGVYLPDGSLLSTIYPENLSPLEPNPLIQISALFSIKRCQ